MIFFSDFARIGHGIKITLRQNYSNPCGVWIERAKILALMAGVGFCSARPAAARRAVTGKSGVTGDRGEDVRIVSDQAQRLHRARARDLCSVITRQNWLTLEGHNSAV